MANVKKHLPISRNKPCRQQLRDQTYASLHETQVRNLGQRDGIFCKQNASIMQRVCCRSQRPQTSGRKWRLRFHKRHGFLRQACRTNVLSTVHHILRTWVAERLAAPLPTHCCENLNLGNCSLVCDHHMSQVRAQSISCNPNLRHNHFCA